MTIRMFESWDIKNDDTYENGAAKAPKARTVTRIASLTPTSPVTVGILRSLTSKAMTVTRIVSWTPIIPVTVHAFWRPELGVRGPYHGGEGDLFDISLGVEGSLTSV